MQIRQQFNVLKTPIWVAASAFAFAFMLATTVWSQSSTIPGNGKAVQPVLNLSPLDGRLFRAGIVREDADDEGKKRPLEDRLLFKDGKFSSAVCKRYNFTAAPYWVRTEGDRVHFLAELASPTDGTMVWKGSIRGDTLEGTMRWTKKRWYWTIDTEHKIRGKLENGVNAASPSTN
jgi:hypothetical protein